MNAWAAEVVPERSVTACLHSGTDQFVGHMAQAEVSKIFERVGVRILWQNPRSCIKADSSVIISLSYKTPETDHPNAWAYALPYEGAHIVVFYDRVEATILNSGARHLLAYVMVHEMTHILQGVVRHSGTGIMKAQWAGNDFFAMGSGSLGFAPEDLHILYLNMDLRYARLAAKVKGAVP